jgi:ribonuclease P protein component
MWAAPDAEYDRSLGFPLHNWLPERNEVPLMLDQLAMVNSLVRMASNCGASGVVSIKHYPPYDDGPAYDQEFVRVYREGVRASGQYIVLWARSREQTGGGVRLGVTASRRVGKAVVRNRCKRRLRELFRSHREWWGQIAVDVVLNARAGCADVRWSELRGEYHRCVRRVRARLTEG